MDRTLDDWIKVYEKKSGVNYEPDSTYTTYFIASKGFAQIKFTKTMVVINQLCGDARFWKKFAESFAKSQNRKYLGTWCIRNIEPYIRLFGFEIEHIEELPDGLKRYHGIDKITKKPGKASPSFIAKNGKIGYMITWEI